MITAITVLLWNKIIEGDVANNLPQLFLAICDVFLSLACTIIAFMTDLALLNKLTKEATK